MQKWNHTVHSCFYPSTVYHEHHALSVHLPDPLSGAICLIDHFVCTARLLPKT